MHTQNVIIRRGAEVVGPDGPVGTVAHVVVDEATREVSELVVRSPGGRDWVLPVRAIVGTTDQAVSLRSDWSDLDSGAQAYAPEEFDTLPSSEVSTALDARTLELREEELDVRKQRHERGTVEIRKEIVAERKVLDVPVWHEELLVERQRVDPPEPSDRPFTDTESFRVVLRAGGG